MKASTAALSVAGTDGARQTLAVAIVTGKLFCGYCQCYADAATGSFLLRNRSKRWMCLACMKLRGIRVQPE